MSHGFSNTRRIRESIRREAQKRWQDIPVNERIDE
jgi:hypothetical protein